MTQSPTLSTPIVKPNTFEFNCHINFDPTRIDVGFDVTWLFDGHPDTNLAPSHITGPTRDVSLDQKYLMGHLGKEVCSLSVLFILAKTPICFDWLHDNWAPTRENLSSGVCEQQRADKPPHPGSLISAFCYSLFGQYLILAC